MSESPKTICLTGSFGPSFTVAAESAGGRDTGFPAFGPTLGFVPALPALPAASVSKRDLSDAID